MAPKTKRAAGDPCARASASTRWKIGRLLGRQRPLGHLDVRARRHVDSSGRRRAPRASPKAAPCSSQRRLAASGPEELLDPALPAPAVAVRARPAAELLAVVAHHPDALAILGRVAAQVVDQVADRLPRDPVAQTLLGAEDASGGVPGRRSRRCSTSRPRAPGPRAGGCRPARCSRSRRPRGRTRGTVPRRARRARRRAVARRTAAPPDPPSAPAGCDGRRRAVTRGSARPSRPPASPPGREP